MAIGINNDDPVRHGVKGRLHPLGNNRGRIEVQQRPAQIQIEGRPANEHDEQDDQHRRVKG